MDVAPGADRNWYRTSPDDTPEDRALDRENLHQDPISQFSEWFTFAKESGIREANAMTVATVGEDGLPSARILLLKGVDETGFLFFTNYESQKARQLAATPYAALVFYWQSLGRQIRVVGDVSKLSQEESEDYYQTRQRGSRIGAWASPQSQVIPDRAFLEKRVAEIESQYPDEEIPLPSHWGGYRLTPVSVEFWQGRTSRLHDRYRYTRNESGSWTIERLAP